MKSFVKWYDKQDAGDFSFMALFLIAGAQICTINLFKEANVKIYLDRHPSYISEIKFERMQTGKGGAPLYRLKFEMGEGKDAIKCDVTKSYNYSPSPYFGRHILVTPKGNDCENPYLTDLEYRPVFNALCGAWITSIASLLLIISALKLRRSAMRSETWIES